MNTNGSVATAVYLLLCSLAMAVRMRVTSVLEGFLSMKICV
jgi:hypothetical protein